MFINPKCEYDRWVRELKNNEILSGQLRNILRDDLEIVDRFSSFLSFGTAGARGLIGIGLNRMNSITVSHMSSSYAEYLCKKFSNPSVVVSYDTRKYSSEFAKISSEIFSANGVKVYLFNSPSPIGLLSFAIRELKCSGGVMVTASHNSPDYNGYKIYNENGAQPVDVNEISSILMSKDIFDFKRLDFDDSISRRKINFIDDSIRDNYIKKVKFFFRTDKIINVNITYSPLNGCALTTFQKLFNFHQLNVVKKQGVIDYSFSTCNPPDPQKENSFSLAFDEAKKNNSDLIILNDPDGDRLGIAVKCNDSYKILTAIEIASLFLDYIINCECKKDIYVIKSIVSVGLCDQIIDFYKIKCIQTLPGFKYISEQIEKIEHNGNLDSFAIGFEESNGFLLFPDIRDKDGISSSVFFCKMVSYYKKKNLNCLDILENLYKKFGYSGLKIISFKEANKSKINKIIDKFKKHFIDNKMNVSRIIDYRNNEVVDFNLKNISCTQIGKSNIVEIEFIDGSKLFIRSSGTEPLIKFYVSYKGKTQNDSNIMYKKIEELILKVYRNFR